jgi:hypothetical protein
VGLLYFMTLTAYIGNNIGFSYSVIFTACTSGYKYVMMHFCRTTRAFMKQLNVTLCWNSWELNNENSK